MSSIRCFRRVRTAKCSSCGNKYIGKAAYVPIRAPVRLRRPTDFLILEGLHSYGRNVAPNLAHITGKSRKNVNNRLPVLADYGLVQKIGPADRSGLYEITDRGRVALRLRDQYHATEDFDALVDRHMASSDATAPAMARGKQDDDVE